MESINFADFSLKERHEIITEFLDKMRDANSMESAHNFFEYYLKKFYKIPSDIINEIAYCQRALRSYIAVHQKLVVQKKPKANKRALNEIEDALMEINAECHYWTIRLDDDIEKFCLPFTEQGLKPDPRLINQMVSQTIVPIITCKMTEVNPTSVQKRPTEKQLFIKYFAMGADENVKPTKAAPKAAKKTKSTGNIGASTSKVLGVKKCDENSLVNQAKSPESMKDLSAVAAKPCNRNSAVKKTDELQIVNSEVNASRLNLQAALARARQNKTAKVEAKANTPKEIFLQNVGLCTHMEYKDLLQSRAISHKRKPKVVKK